jgi:hypothetical protein
MSQLAKVSDDPESPHPEIRHLIVEFWNDLDIDGDPGSATWEELEALRLEVTKCLQSETPTGTQKAKSLTAKALLLIEGSLGN